MTTIRICSSFSFSPPALGPSTSGPKISLGGAERQIPFACSILTGQSMRVVLRAWIFTAPFAAVSLEQHANRGALTVGRRAALRHQIEHLGSRWTRPAARLQLPAFIRILAFHYPSETSARRLKESGKWLQTHEDRRVQGHVHLQKAATRANSGA
jgi:hypothetical protein